MTWDEFFECDNCQALHLPHMQNFDGVFDAKIDLIDNTILFSAMAEVRPSAVLPLAADLSAINASSLTVKAFLDMQDDNLPKLVVCQSLSVMQGVTYEQFAWFVRQSEEQISMVILEANAHQLLLQLTMKGKTTLLKTISSTDNLLSSTQSLRQRLRAAKLSAVFNLFLKIVSLLLCRFGFIT